MNPEFEGTNNIESLEARADVYLKEAEEIAQRLSRHWQSLREKRKANPGLLALSPKLEEIDSMSRPPISGIQSYFESQVKWIKEHTANDANAMYRLKEEMKHVETELMALIA